MQIEGTKQAFTLLLNTRGIYKVIGVERSTVSSWKIRMREGDGVSLEKMEEILLTVGAMVIQEKIWKLPDNFSKQEKFVGSSLNPEHLRIGNLIKCMYKGGTIVPVTVGVLEELYTSDGTKYSGIVLTEEWLVKFGFIEMEDTVPEGYPTFQPPGIPGRIYFSDLSGLFNWAVYPTLEVDNQIVIAEIKYVNQLQNLYFAITYNELTLK